MNEIPHGMESAYMSNYGMHSHILACSLFFGIREVLNYVKLCETKTRSMARVLAHLTLKIRVGLIRFPKTK